jgi:uncharacterized protein (TIGR02145 family)
MKRKFWFYLITISGVLLIFITGYKQDNNNNTETDYDGNVYHTVTIGTQIWMVENLKTTHYRNGDPIPNVPDNTQWSNLTTGAYCNYNNDANNAKTYGLLYNWYAAINSLNICPVGWHVPSANEWKKLETYLGGVGVAGGKMKEAGTTHWISPNTKAGNSSGFSGLPGGFRNTNGTFDTMGAYGQWWSSTEFSVTSAWHRNLYYNVGFDDNVYGYKTDGFSIRCIKDN